MVGLTIVEIRLTTTTKNATKSGWSRDDPLNDQLGLLIPGSIKVLRQRLPVIIKGALARPKRKQIFCFTSVL